MGLVDAMSRSASAVALDFTEARIITDKTFGAYFSEQPDKVLAIMQHMSGRIRELTRDYMDACKVAAETVDAEKTGKEKSGWLKEQLKRFADAYDATAVYQDMYWPGLHAGHM